MQQHFYVEYFSVKNAEWFTLLARTNYFIYFDAAYFNAPLCKKLKFINPEHLKFEYFFQSVSHSLRRARRKGTVNNILPARNRLWELNCENGARICRRTVTPRVKLGEGIEKTVREWQELYQPEISTIMLTDYTFNLLTYTFHHGHPDEQTHHKQRHVPTNDSWSGIISVFASAKVWRRW